MSNVKRQASLPGQFNGPYYSRYTEHKVVTCLQTVDEPTTSGATPHFTFNPDHRHPSATTSVSDSPVADSWSGSLDNPLTPDRSSSTDPQPYLLESGDEAPSPISRGNSSDSFQSSLRASPLEFRPLSPRFPVYENQGIQIRRESPDYSNVSPSPSVLSDSARERRSVCFDRNAIVNNNHSKSKFANLVSRHSVNIFAAAVFKVAHTKSRQKQLTHSCPELITTHRESIPQDSKKKTVSIGELGSYRTDLNGQVHSKKNKLKVPDIFTTSYTHSVPKEPPQRSNTISLHNISETAERQNQRKDTLRRTISLTKAVPEDLKISRFLCGDMYRDDQMSQITDYLFIGTIESAFNERRLCRLEIESLVDISNMNEMQVPAHRKTQCPCLCQIEFKHFRSRLIIGVADEENENIDQYFEEVSKFIEGARRCSKKVLIYSFEGKSRAALFAIQYLMAYEGLLLRQAYNIVKKQRPQVSLNPSFQRALEKLEKTLFPDEKHSVNICNEYLNVADPQAIKCAWIDC